LSTTKRPRGRPARGGAKPAAGVARHPAFDRDDHYEKRREAMVQTAIHIFNRHGYHETSMEAIASALGLTKGSLYHYYSGKTALAYDCVLASARDGLRMASIAREGGGTGLERLERYLRLQFETLAGRGGSGWMLADISVLEPDQQAEVRRQSRKVDTIVQGFIGDGIADGSIAKVNPKVAEFFLIGALNWLPRWFSPEGALSSDELAAVFIRMMFDGLRAKAPNR
jgi:TetR/AcrR family transcriptional regulator